MPKCFFESIAAGLIFEEHIVLYPTGGGNLNGDCPKLILAALPPDLLPRAGANLPKRFE